MMNKFDVMQIKNFLLIWQDAGFCLLNIQYTNPIKLDADMLAGLLRAIQQVMSDGIKRITWKHQTILFEFVDDLLYVLITSSISNESTYRNKLFEVIDRVGKRFQERPEWPKLIGTGQIRTIRECALDVIQSFNLRAINPNLTPKLQENCESIPFAIREFNEILERLIGFIDGKRTVYQIIDGTSFERDTVLGLLSVLLAYNWIKLIRVVTIEDKLKLTREPTVLDLCNLGPKDLLGKVIHEFEETTTSQEVADKLRINPHVVLFLTRKLLEGKILTFMK